MRQTLTGGKGGQHVLITRPAGQGATLQSGIARLGGRVSHIPFLAITATTDLTALEAIAKQLKNYEAVVFISANAVQMAMPVLTREEPWPNRLAAAVVGPGTARVLRGLGVGQILMPVERYDSEGLLALPELAPNRCEGRRFALIKGEGGRDLITRTLRDRGAQVDEATTYQRSLDIAAVGALQALMVKDKPTAMIVTSSESLERFMRAAPATLASAVKQVAIIAPHERIAHCAIHLGFKDVHQCAGGDEGILTFLQTYNGSSSTGELGMDVL